VSTFIDAQKKITLLCLIPAARRMSWQKGIWETPILTYITKHHMSHFCLHILWHLGWHVARKKVLKANIPKSPLVFTFGLRDVRVTYNLAFALANTPGHIFWHLFSHQPWHIDTCSMWQVGICSDKSQLACSVVYSLGRA
jgi:hypothetical protein